MQLGKFLTKASVWLGGILMAGQVMATDLPISDMPLALRTASALPNVMFLMDDSGSMDENDVFYAPGYDSDFEYRCSSGTELASDNSKTLTIYVSDRNGYNGTPYFTYGTATYGWGGSGSADGAAGTAAARVCFTPKSEYVVKFKDYTKKTTCPGGYSLNTIGGDDKECRDTDTRPADTWGCPTGYTRGVNTNNDSDDWCWLNADLKTWQRYNGSSNPRSCPSPTTDYRAIKNVSSSSNSSSACGLISSRISAFIPGECPAGFEELGTNKCTRTTDLLTPYFVPGSTTRVLTGNFLNWYLSKTEARLSSNVLLPGYASYNPVSPWDMLATNDDPAGVPWTQQPADNFRLTNDGDRRRMGMKDYVSFTWDRISVAKDVGKVLIRKIDNVNFALSSFWSNALGTKGTGDGGWLMHAFTSFEVPVDDPSTTDDDAKVAATLAATKVNKASVINVLKNLTADGYTPTSESMLRMARYIFSGWDDEKFKFFNKVDAATPQVTPRSFIEQKVSDILDLPLGTRVTGAVQYKTTPNVSAGSWCQKSAMAVLTDGMPSYDLTVDANLKTYDTVGVTTTEENRTYSIPTWAGGTTNADVVGLVRVAGALFDHDWIPTIRGNTNIETFFIGFGNQDVVQQPVFYNAGMAAGGGTLNYWPAQDGGAVVEAFKKIIERVTADSLSITAIAVSSVSELKTENYAFQATYDTEYFSSDLKALRVNEQGEFVQPDGSGGSRLSTDIKPVWNTLEMMNRMYAMNDGALTGVTPAPNTNYRDPRNRLVYTWSGAAGTRFGSFTMARPGAPGTSFTEFSNLPLKIRNDLSAWAGTNNQERYDLMMYLLGDPKNELYYPTADTMDNEKYRQRGTFGDKDNDGLIDTVASGGLLGDIVNSSPQYQKAPAAQWNDIHYGTATQKFSRFKELHADRPAVVYVGSNDGMLHAITVAGDKKVVGATTLNIPAGGELFAYMPSILASSNANEGLHNLADPYYKHKFMVDLTPTISDVFVDFYVSGSADPEWRSVLVGGLGKGGRGYYALDVTCPTKDTSTHTPKGETVAVQNTCADEEFGPGNVLWEFSDADDADMGYSFSEPIIAKINYDSGISNDPNSDHGGRWAVITGNGYNSKFGRAALYILFLDGGRDGTWTEGVDYLKIYVSSVDDDAASKNGLSSPTAIDINYDGLIDRVYAGDLKGQMWSFDISAAADSSDYASTMPWSVNKLFTTGVDSSTPQPITTAPAVSRDNSYGRIFPTTAPDLMVIFGTGRYLTELDIYDDSLQTLYAVHDRGVYNLTRYDSVTVSGQSYPILEPRIFKEVTLSTGTTLSKNRTIEGDPINPGQYGWYVDLASDINDDDIISGSEIKGERLVFRPIVIGPLFINKSIIPNPGSCAGATQSWTTIIDWTTGGAYKEATYDANLDGVINATDLYYVSQFNEAGGSALGRGGSNLFDSVGADARSTSYNFGNVTLSLRIGWEEILPFGIRGE